MVRAGHGGCCLFMDPHNPHPPPPPSPSPPPPPSSPSPPSAEMEKENPDCTLVDDDWILTWSDKSTSFMTA